MKDAVFGVALFVFAIVAGLSIAATLGRAQERGGRPTYQWVIPVEGTYEKIYVIDTAGVCLYVMYAKNTVAAVPKTQLPTGAGCQ